MWGSFPRLRSSDSLLTDGRNGGDMECPIPGYRTLRSVRGGPESPIVVETWRDPASSGSLSVRG